MANIPSPKEARRRQRAKARAKARLDKSLNWAKAYLERRGFDRIYFKESVYGQTETLPNGVEVYVASNTTAYILTRR